MKSQNPIEIPGFNCFQGANHDNAQDDIEVSPAALREQNMNERLEMLNLNFANASGIAQN